MLSSGDAPVSWGEFNGFSAIGILTRNSLSNPPDSCSDNSPAKLMSHNSAVELSPTFDWNKFSASKFRDVSVCIVEESSRLKGGASERVAIINANWTIDCFDPRIQME